MSRTFNGTSDNITVSLGAVNVAYGTCAAIIKHGVDGVSNTIIHTGASTSGGNRWICAIDTTNALRFFMGNAGEDSPTITVTAAMGWVLVAWAKDNGGTFKNRYHKCVLSTGVWTHEDGSATHANAGLPIVTSSTIGAQPVGSGFFNGEIAVVGLWNSFFTDAQVESLAWNLGEWSRFSQPKGLWVLDQRTASELLYDRSGGGANQSAISGTTVTDPSPQLYLPGHAVHRKVP